MSSVSNGVQINNGKGVDCHCDDAEQKWEPKDRIKKEAYLSSMDEYDAMYRESVEEPEKFWTKIAAEFHWRQSPSNESGSFLKYNFDHTKGPVSIKWMEGGVTNVCYNAIDRHIENGIGDNVAFYWEGNDPNDVDSVTFIDMKRRVCQLANALKARGIVKGDRVAVYMPMILELPIALLACARIGAIHSVVFGGYSAKALASRIMDGGCKLVLTADGSFRGTKLIELKTIVDQALDICAASDDAAVGSVSCCIVVKHLGCKDESQSGGDSPPAKRPYRQVACPMKDGRDVWWHEAVDSCPAECEVEWTDAETPLFMLYTSGSTGKPKGVLHTTAGYMIYAATTFKYVFDSHKDDVYFCTADVGWITGHSYLVYGPLLNGTTGIVFEGLPSYPDDGRFWEICAKHRVTKFYTAPTAIRSLMKKGEDWVTKHDLSSLKILGSVGEPINPEAWLWYYRVVGRSNCSIVDTFWQTETGGHVLTPLPGATPMKPGSATFPFFGVVPTLLNESGEEIRGEGEGYLVFRQPWPGIMRTVYGNHDRFETTYFKKFPGFYCTGDGARRDKDGYLWVTGRIDDMMNCSGHLMSTAEMESALIEHPAVAESAVVSKPHAVKGECAYVFVTLRDGHDFNDALCAQLIQKIRTKIAPFAQPDVIQNAPALPKTRSGKIMRRVLRKIAMGERDGLGDISTMADESVIDQLFELRPAMD